MDKKECDFILEGFDERMKMALDAWLNCGSEKGSYDYVYHKGVFTGWTMAYNFILECAEKMRA